MKKVFLIIILFYSFFSDAQNEIEAVIKDAQTLEPLSYCNVIIKSKNIGSISNSEGVFRIIAKQNDTLCFSYLGYKTRYVQVINLMKSPVILLERSEIVLNEIEVYPDNSFLYDIVTNCRKNLMKNKLQSTSKVYFGLETESTLEAVNYPTRDTITIRKNNKELKPKLVEQLECFYNAQIKGSQVTNLLYKNGRTALAADENYFLSLNTSKAVSSIDLLKKQEYIPSIPLQFNRKSLEKLFNIEMGSFDGVMYNLIFTPKIDSSSSFSGEIWIDADSFNLLKINLYARHTHKHPFIPIHPSLDDIEDVNLSFTFNFKLHNGASLPDHLQFSYDMIYNSNRDSLVIIDQYKNVSRKISTEGILYFYDYNEPFILPIFDYVEDVDDYYKMSFIPYNDVFWKQNKILVLTAQQKENVKIIEDNGYLINYREGNFGSDFLKDLPGFNNSVFREFYYTFWSAKKRIIPNNTSEQFKTFPNDIINANIRRNLYNLKAQLLLDINEIDNGLICKSYTVFDNFYSYFHLPFDFSTNAIFNIFFDICEIERRKMQAILDSKPHSLDEVLAIYNSTILEMNKVTKQFLEEIDLGENQMELKKWNQYVYEKLNINNIELINNTNR